jgi:hypothetical protein
MKPDLAKRCIEHIDTLLVEAKDERDRLSDYPMRQSRLNGYIDELQILLDDLRAASQEGV